MHPSVRGVTQGFLIVAPNRITGTGLIGENAKFQWESFADNRRLDGAGKSQRLAATFGVEGIVFDQDLSPGKRVIHLVYDIPSASTSFIEVVT